ncbi:hypothetical protein ACFC0C_32485 [Streptomyces sp. NPDC056178]|uniref:hypothetical protein n=1 Tax=unclassified Streptomyces TaxID=2593676 RepID=UPI0035D726B8
MAASSRLGFAMFPGRFGRPDRQPEAFGPIARALAKAEPVEHPRLSPATITTRIGRLPTTFHARDRAQSVIVAYETRSVGDRRTGM